MIFLGFLVLLAAGGAIAFVLPLGPAPAAIGVGVGATIAMLVAFGLGRRLYKLLRGAPKSSFDTGRERRRRVTASFTR